jgi:perosamine synthetase
MKKRKIKLFDPKIDSVEKKNIELVFDSHNWASGSGSTFVNSFEKKFITYIGAKSGVAVNSGTAALHLAVSCISKEKGEIIVPSLSFVSTAHCVKYSGHKVIFSDVDPLTGCIDPVDIKKKISKKTKAIIPVHFAGLSCDLSKISDIAKTHNIPIIEDASHATGTKYDKKRIGSHSDLVCFSFHPVKNLAMPSGGFIAINSKNDNYLKNDIETKKWCGISDRVGSNYDVKDLGWNYYMNEFSAAIGIAQLSKLSKLNKSRRNNAKEYFKRINVDSKMPYDASSSYHFYWILVNNRDQIREKLHKLGIETGTHYKPIHKMSYYNKKTTLSETEKFSEQIITLPTHPNLINLDIDYVIENINKII